jgi:hypothetical protein
MNNQSNQTYVRPSQNQTYVRPSQNQTSVRVSQNVPQSNYRPSQKNEGRVTYKQGTLIQVALEYGESKTLDTKTYERENVRVNRLDRVEYRPSIQKRNINRDVVATQEKPVMNKRIIEKEIEALIE